MSPQLEDPQAEGSRLKSYLAVLKALPGAAFRRYKGLPLYGKVLFWLWILFEIALLTALIVITPSRVAQFLYDKAEKLAQLPLGWLVVGSLVALVSFPPLHGHTTLTTVCGFAWGLKGFLIAAPASLIGAGLTFCILRLFFHRRLRALSKSNENWTALEEVVGAKGLPLMILIRASPFPPWVYSNVLFASIGSVALWQFLVSTCFVFPKIFLQVFIGWKIAALSDGEQRNKMDTQTKVLNGLLIGTGIGFAILASWWVYTSVQNHIRKLPDFSPETDELAAEALEDTEETPFLTSNPDNV
ncbi:Golgi apparatus membrane protein TVP38 [Roridomyces roridus]|uniref:Golgi apparatus membrane protein TVP38 n=1 Tax=Roridomyces roridus TaxID=1738132 RepID=A0AAD7C4G5_9AGAR|nr:Golgi apparatus membrane protein TVP38 [Roridomyces roridus]